MFATHNFKTLYRNIKMDISKSLLLLGLMLVIIYTVSLTPSSFNATYSLMIKRQQANNFGFFLLACQIFDFISAITGLLGVCAKDSDLLKWYLITAVGLIIARPVLFMIEGDGLPRDRDVFMGVFNSCLESYKWERSLDDSKLSLKCAELIDPSQDESCCGVNSYKDWDEYRPENLTSSIYPRSCCSSPQTLQEDEGPYCVDNSDLYRIGCAEFGMEFWSRLFFRNGIFVLYQLILSIIVVIYWLRMKPDDVVDSSTVNDSQPTPKITTLDVEQSNYGRA